MKELGPVILIGLLRFASYLANLAANSLLKPVPETVGEQKCPRLSEDYTLGSVFVRDG
jgi:hypothetical protein